MENGTIDLSPYYLLVATPIMDGKPDDTYAVSLDHTKQIIQRYGGKIDVFKVKYIADLAYARSKLFGAFLRHKEATHLLMIDADMGWPPEEVAYMLLLNREFLAAVGPKKKYPIEFAYNLVGDDGKVSPLYHELQTNVAEFSFVGGAFVMISRSCAEEMAKAYSDTRFTAEDGLLEYGVFDTVIINNEKGEKIRRLSEDYSFCWRWKKIGGKIEAKMDVTLQHSGNHTFSGNLYEHFLKTEPGFSNEKTQK